MARVTLWFFRPFSCRPLLDSPHKNAVPPTYFSKICRAALFYLTQHVVEGNNVFLGSLTQAVEYLPFKQRVAGSNPARPTNFPFQEAPQNIKHFVGFQCYERTRSRAEGMADTLAPMLNGIDKPNPIAGRVLTCESMAAADRFRVCDLVKPVIFPAVSTFSEPSIFLP